MSNGDEILNALAHGSLAEFGNAVLCHHQVRQVPGDGDNGPRVQRGDDAGESALFGGGALGEDGLGPMDSAQTWPVRSIWREALTDTTLSFLAMT